MLKAKQVYPLTKARGILRLHITFLLNPFSEIINF